MSLSIKTYKHNRLEAMPYTLKIPRSREYSWTVKQNVSLWTFAFPGKNSLHQKISKFCKNTPVREAFKALLKTIMINQTFQWHLIGRPCDWLTDSTEWYGVNVKTASLNGL